MSEEVNDNNEVDLQKALEEKDAMIKDLQTQFNAVKGKADELLDETKKAKARAREETEIATRAQEEKARKNGDFEQLLQSSEKEREALANQMKDLQNRVGAEKTRTESMRLAAELADGANAELLSEFIGKRLKYTDDGLKVLDKNGDLTVSSLDDLKREFENNDKFQSLIRGNKSTGGGAAGDGGSASGVSKMERSRFDKMGPTEKMEFIRKGGKLSD